MLVVNALLGDGMFNGYGQIVKPQKRPFISKCFTQ